MHSDFFAFPTSFAQQRLWFLDQLHPGSPLYNVFKLFQFQDGLDSTALEEALNEIIKRHDSLRTTFQARDGRPYQLVTSQLRVPLRVVDLTSFRGPRRQEEISRITNEGAASPFDLARGPLLRTTLIRLSENEGILLVTMHHIITDGWSTEVFSDELMALYEAFRSKKPSTLQDLPVQYPDFAVWQRKWLESDGAATQLAYWKQKLAGAPVVVDLPWDFPRPAAQTFAGDTHPIVLADRLSQDLIDFSRRQGVTLFMTLLAGFKILLARLSSSRDFVIGTPIAGRAQAEVEPVIGLFVNTLTLRADLSGNPPLWEVLRRTEKTALEAYAHQELPFDSLVAELAPERSLAQSPLVHIMFALRNEDEGSEAEDNGFTDNEDHWESNATELTTGTAKFDLTLTMFQSGDSLSGQFEYSTDLLRAETVEWWAELYERCLEVLIANPEARLDEFPLLTPAEHDEAVHTWNNTGFEYPRDATLGDLFAEQAALHPHQPAVECGDDTLTFRELDDLSLRIAGHLTAAGVAPGDRVAVCLPRSTQLVVSLLGIVRCGAAYVPIDNAYPQDRIRHIVADSAPHLILTVEPLRPIVSGSTVPVVTYDEILAAGAAGPPPQPCVSSAESVAYIMYTSGSTGLPKGVSIPHRAIVRLVRNTNYVSIGAGDRIALASNPSFDAATFEIWGALLNGAAIVVLDRDTILSPEKYAATLRDQRITILFATTALFNLVAREAPHAFSPVRQVMFGGENADPKAVRSVLGAGKPHKLLNVYGPTETTTFATFHEIKSLDRSESNIPIGRPIGNTQVYVLDASLHPQPAGVVGELYIGGDGLAVEYFRAPELTKEKFVPNPFGPGRLYRTGDLARYQADGTVEFCGRRDHQVKIRGFRVELGEIEAALQIHPAIQDAVVQAHALNGFPKQLLGYLVWRDGQRPSVSDLRSWMRERLPEHMIPSAWVELPSLPLNANGKVDRLRLPLPDAERPDLAVAYTEPRNELERNIADVWSALLGIEKIGIHDNFFELGGHSLLATQTVSRIRDLINVDLHVRLIFQCPTVSALAEAIGDGKCSRANGIPRRGTSGPAPLSFSQQRLWFLDQLDPESALYNIHDVMIWEGRLDVAALERALSEVVSRHEALRTTIRSVDGVPVQSAGPLEPIRLSVTDFSRLNPVAAQERCTLLSAEEQARPFDLTTGPLFRARLVKVAGGDHRLLMTVHHIVTDGWSLGILHREVKELYGAFSEGRDSPLPALPLQYADFAVWQRNHIQGEELGRLIAWWRTQLAGAPSVINLPTDRSRPAVQTFRGETLTKGLPASIMRSIDQLGQGEGATLFMTLLTAWYVLLHRFSGEEDILVGTPIANRTRTELEPLIGFFVNTLIIRGSISGNPTFRELLRQVRDAANGAYAHQDLPFERLVAELAPERRLSHTPLFQCFFALHGALHGASNGQAPEIPLHNGDDRIEVVPSTSMFDLSLTMDGSGGQLVASFEYSTELFDTSTIMRLMGQLERLLSGVVANPDLPIFAYDLLGDQERQQVLYGFNSTRAAYPKARSVVEMFEICAQSRTLVAVRFEERALLYSELNACANRLAHYLRSLGIGPGATVGLCLDRTPVMIIALLGILKAGGAYVPLDPEYPRQRLGHMITDCGMRALVTSDELSKRLPRHSATIVRLDSDWPDVATFPSDDPIPSAGLDDPAYVIYTSGSTGEPKGVPIHHRALLNYIEAASEEYEITAQDRVLQFFSINFDGSVEEIFAALSRGATLVLRTPMMVTSIAEFLARCEEWSISVVSLPTAFWHEMVARIAADDLAIPSSLRLVIIGGDRASPDRVATWQRLVKASVKRSVRLMNTYGPTEATVVATMYRIGRKPLPAGEVPIGKPIRNTRVYVLDRFGQPVPIGVRGELCIAGDGVSAGYLNREEQSQTKFAFDPFSVEASQRMYRTGDLVRWRASGDLEFCGRADRQVKVRGFRVELEEIESALNQHEAVKDSIVTAHEDAAGNKRLIAYIVPDQRYRQEETPSAGQVSAWEAVFDNLYAEVDPEHTTRFYIKGWDSSYTGGLIASEEVETWMAQTVDRVLSLSPRRVREIGCGGSGLMLFRIAPHCEEYTGTDLSQNALQVLEHQISKCAEPMPGVRLVHCAAHEQALDPDSVDALLIVSVAQYFPNIQYLAEVIERAVEGIAPGGFLFLGDVRNYRLLDAFHASVQLFQASPSLSTSELRRRVRKHVASEKQLTVDPIFFHALIKRIPKITAVETRLLRGRNRNELTRFRYDVILHVGGPAAATGPVWIDWSEAKLTLGRLREMLIDDPGTVKAFAGIPNARVQRDVAAARILGSDDEPPTVAQLESLLAAEPEGVDPEDIWEIASELGFEADISWSPTSDDGAFDAVFRAVASTPSVGTSVDAAGKSARATFANDPSRKISVRKLGPELRSFLSEQLPDYMVPAQFMVLDSLPLTPSGKVDRKALPAPDRNRPELDADFSMPRTAIEQALVRIWAEVLDIELVGIHDNFFDLGGDSILSIQIIARANEVGLRFTPKQLFQHQTIAELAAVAGSGAGVRVEQGPVTGDVPLTPIQRWFFEANLPHAHQFTQSAFFDLDESANLALVERILAELDRAHDAFRLRYVQEGKGWRQFQTEAAGHIPVVQVNLSTLSRSAQAELIDSTAAGLQRNLNLSAGPVARAALFDYGPTQPCCLMIVAHHLVIDGVSWRILDKDIRTLLDQTRNGKPLQLPAKTTSFKYWAERLCAFVDSTVAREALEFWLSQFSSGAPAIPLDHYRSDGVGSPESARIVTISLGAAETRDLLHEVPKAYRTQINDVLLAALALAFSDWTGESKLLIDLEGHGREPIFDDVDLSRTVGWFTSVYPLLLDLTGIEGYGEILRSLKEQLRRVPARGISFGALRYLCTKSEIVARLQELPRPQVSFNYLGQFGGVRMFADFREAEDDHAGGGSSVSLSSEVTRGEWGATSHLIDINGGVNDGRLWLTWAFSEKFHRPATIQSLAERFVSKLRLITAHCKIQDARGYSPSDFPLARLDQKQLDWLVGSDRQIEDIYPLSPMQEGLLFHSLYHPDSGEYIEQSLSTLPGNVDVEAFCEAWDRLVERHPILRTCFVWSGLDSPLQIVRQRVQLTWETHDLRSIDLGSRERQIEEFLESDRTRGFDLSRAPLLRFSLFRSSDAQIQFLWTSHHILLDGWSQPRLLQELYHLYEAIRDGRDAQLEPVRPYRHYIEWLLSQDLSLAENFWRDYLMGFTSPTPLVIAQADADDGPKDYREHQIEFTEAERTAIEDFARECAVTPNTVAQAAWAILLSRYSQEHDILFGATVSGRPAEVAGVESMIGLFINTIPVRVQVNPRATIAQWLKELQRQQLDVREFEHTPLVRVQACSGVPRGKPLFETLFVFENYPDVPSLVAEAAAPAETDGPSVPLERTNFPITVAVIPGSRWAVRVTYDSVRFSFDSVVRLLGHYRTILGSLARQCGQPISCVELLTQGERRQILEDWNCTARHASPVPAHRLLEQQVVRTPNAVAVSLEPYELTYSELNERANQLARFLRGFDLGNSSLVALCLERSLDIAVAVAGILKAGFGYVPLDPSYPKERLAFMLEDSGARVLLTHRHLAGRLPDFLGQTIILDESREQIAKENSTDLEVEPSLDTTAYVIYTSGSTGTPKGVAMPHGPLANLILWQITRSTPRCNAHTLQFAPVSFDVHFQEMFSTWASGGTLVLITERLRRDTDALVEYMSRHTIDRVFLPFVALQQLAEVATRPGSTPLPLQEIITAGEQLQCSPAIIRLFEALPAAILQNQYGPSESHVVTSFQLPGRPEEWPLLPPIGKPIDNARIYILDEQMGPVPVGVPGQLFIGGPVLASGYLNRPDLTGERFVADPFSSDEGARLYATGDLACFLPSGDIEFLGRMDFQVKVRGFRIELGEVEVVLAQHAEIRQCAVTVWEDSPGDRRLVAYIVSASKPDPSTADLRAFLESRLPDYMVPSTFVILDALPVTPSGKVNRLELPAPEWAGFDRPFQAPRDPVEERLAAIYADVLRVERIGIDDNFFDLGGHSLLATRIISRIREAFQVELPLRVVFQAPTVSALAVEVLRAGSTALREIKIPRRREAGTCPLSYAQQRLWFLDQLQPNTPLYNVHKVFYFQGDADEDALRRSINEIIRRHEVLRTTFVAIDGRPFQLIAATAQIALPVHDLIRLRTRRRLKELVRITSEITGTPFDLVRGPLIRAGMIRVNRNETQLIIAMHHIVTDGWSMEVFTRELKRLYESDRSGQLSGLEEPTIQYADYAVWQRQWIEGQLTTVELAYWRKKLEGAPSQIDLPWDRAQPDGGGAIHVALPESLSTRVFDFSRTNSVTLFITLLSAFKATLARLSGCQDILVGTPVAGRTHTELEVLIGFFVNTLVLRTNLSGNPTLNEVLRRAAETALEAFDHQDLPFDRLVAELAPGREPGRNPLVQVMFAMQDSREPGDRLENSETAPVVAEVDTASAKFDLTFTVLVSDSGFNVAVEFSTGLLTPETALRWVRIFQCTLEALVSNGDQRLQEFAIITPEERHQALVTWNSTRTDYPRDATIQELFAAQVRAHPESVAVQYGQQRLSYFDLDRLSQAFATYLIESGVLPGDRVALCLERSPELIAAMLAIVRCGAAYVPIDPTYPAERARYILEDSAARLVVDTEFLRRIPNEICRIDLPSGSADAIAYVMYTSGSTGRPKGACIPQRAITRLVLRTNYVDITAEDRIAQASNCSFDAATFEIWGALLNGAAVIGIDRDTCLSPRSYSQAIHEQRISILFVTTPLFNQLACDAPDAFAPLKQVMFGGEPADPQAVRAVLVAGKPRSLMNVYGPTETTTFATFHEISKLEENEASIPIGRAISNTQVFVLSEHLDPQPVGLTGEIHIGGDGLAFEYWNAPDLTAEKFIPNPFGPGRLYRTGDLGRYRSDGSIEFLGRRDLQVKVRGFRVEPGEIESALRMHPAVCEAVVHPYAPASGPVQLAAYVVWEPGRRITASELRDWLEERLPSYMVPAVWVELDALPLNANGKIDRGALPAPQEQRPFLDTTYSAPATVMEAALATIWRPLLHVDTVGRDDNFFDLGGHSLLATQVVSRVRDRLGIEVPVRLLFERPTIRALAAMFDKSGLHQTSTRQISRRTAAGPCPLSFSQQRLWFLDQLDPGTPLFHIHDVIAFEGEIDPDALEQALSEIVRRHEALRTSFTSIDGVAMQVIDPPETVRLPVSDLTALSPDERGVKLAVLSDEESQRPFHLARGPLFRAHLVKLGRGDYRLMLTLHHIVADGWSLAILHREIRSLYSSCSVGLPSTLDELPVQYADFSVWQQDYLFTGALNKQIEYWKRQLSDLPPVTELPLDHKRPQRESSFGARQTLQVPADVASELREMCQRHQVTPFMLMLAAYKLLLHRYTGQSDIVIGCPVAGRTRVEIENLIGFFLNTLALRTDMSGDLPFSELLARVRQTALDAFANQDVPFETLLEDLAPGRASREQIFRLFFNVINFDTSGGDQLAVPSGGPSGQPSEPASTRSIFDLTLYVFEQADGLLIEAVYRTDLFEARTISRLLRHLETIFETVVRDPDIRASRVSLTNGVDDPCVQPVEPTNRFIEFTAEETEQSIGQRFVSQAQRYSRRIAVKTPRYEWTYAELERRSRLVALNLLAEGYGSGQRIALLFEHDAPMLAGMLGALRAGTAYVPLDPSYPRDRLLQIVADAEPAAVLTDSPNESAASILGVPSFNIERTPAIEMNVRLREVSGAAFAYILYTSGSTGQPKGVVQNHRNVLRHIRAYTNALRISARDRLAQLAAYGFDAAVMDIFGALLNGATLYPVSVRQEQPEELVAWLEAEAISIYHSTPTVFRHLVSGDPPQNFRAVRAVVLGGEECLRRDFDLYRAHFGTDCILINGLGPTESTLALQYFLDHSSEVPRNAVPVGYPVAGTEVLLLGPGGEPIPGAGTGELAFRGRSVALGYWRRPEITAQVFATDSNDPDVRTYRTGDLAHRLPDGRLEFIGRADLQVKIRGVRIELGEIESRILQNPAVLEAAVRVLEPADGNRHLAAYIVARPGADLSAAALRRFLRESLPEPMVPSAFVILDALPLTPNGKVHREALPEPGATLAEPSASFVAPSTPVERLLASIWSSLLRVPQISVSDSFFDLGGYSLLAMQLASRVRSVFQVEIPLRQFFETPTLVALAEVIQKAPNTSGARRAPVVSRVSRDLYRVSVSPTGELVLPRILAQSPAAPVASLPAAAGT